MPRLVLLVLLLLLGAGCASLVDRAVARAVSADASEVRARHGADPMPGDPQVLMTRPTATQPGDHERARRILDTARQALQRYHDVAEAEADGYRSFPAAPPPDLQVIHYIHTGIDETAGVDYTQPGSLLYERDGHGGLRLLGAMYTAPVDAPLAELDARVPLSVTQWHLHQNVCVPRPVWDREAWARTDREGRPVFGPKSRTVTEAACDRLGGRFLPTVFGWMAHVNVFAEDPADIWNAHYGHNEPHGDGGHHGH
ncbi:MAG: hypothetical protein AAF845_06910 [Bacteroidota bacterium]